MTATANVQNTGRAVAGEELFESLAHFVVTHHSESAERAERIADQAVAFVVTAATATVSMVPSNDVDLGLHALILHTKESARLCERYAGRFLQQPEAGWRGPRPGEGGGLGPCHEGRRIRGLRRLVDRRRREPRTVRLGLRPSLR